MSVYGIVRKSGGGEFRVTVNRETQSYPEPGSGGVWLTADEHVELLLAQSDLLAHQVRVGRNVPNSIYPRPPRQFEYHVGASSPVVGCNCPTCERARGDDARVRAIVREEIENIPRNVTTIITLPSKMRTEDVRLIADALKTAKP